MGVGMSTEYELMPEIYNLTVSHFGVEVTSGACAGGP